MTSRRFGLALATLLAAGCGNYSNEDLAYMNALPTGSELRANIPPVTGAVQLANEAELARATHETTGGFNSMLALLVGFVDTIRSFPPTARTATSRIWGPYPADRKQLKNRDWETRMTVSRAQGIADRFEYEIALHHDGNFDTDWPVFIRGWFQTGQTARRGLGHVELLTAAVRAERLEVSDLNELDHLEIDYDTVDDPITIDMHITNLPDPASPDPAPRIDYQYRESWAGQGEMTFDLYQNVIPGDAVEDMRVISHWLSTGEGRATLTIAAGEGMGSQQVECWGRSFQATYNWKPWAPMEETPVPPPADPGELCPTIPLL